MARLPLTLAFGVAAAVAAVLPSPAARAQVFGPRHASETIDTYCAICHNDQLRTAGLVLDPAEVTRIPGNAERWEKVLRKLRTASMPPPGLPRPDEATYKSLAAFVQNELDRAAAAKPEPGKVPSMHRLTRTEYQNSVRDLLALDALPEEMDYSLLLPPDNSGSGFDNIADLLFVSPTAMESYLGAAEKLSRLAVGTRPRLRWSTFTGCRTKSRRPPGWTNCHMACAAEWQCEPGSRWMASTAFT